LALGQARFALHYLKDGSFMQLPFRLFPRLLHPGILGVVVLAASVLPASATQIVDPANDFLASFTGTRNLDLDVLTAEVFYDGTNFRFTSTENGAIGTTANALFVWGVNRGSNAAPFGAFRPGVLFDAVVILRPDGTGTVLDTTNAVPPANLAAGSVTISGNSISGLVPATLLASLGFTPEQYQVNLWPRTGLGDNALIADFAPDNSDAAVTVTPEPSTLLTLGSALSLLVLAGRRRK